jgi:hypothetical protein
MLFVIVVVVYVGGLVPVVGCWCLLLSSMLLMPVMVGDGCRLMVLLVHWCLLLSSMLLMNMVMVVAGCWLLLVVGVG